MCSDHRPNRANGPAAQYDSKPVLLIELKYDKDAKTALDQIKNRHYPERLEHYKGHILLVAINYDRQAKNTDFGYKHHSCKIEKA